MNLILSKPKLAFACACLLVAGESISQAVPDKAKPASSITYSVNDKVYSQLNFADTIDQADASRGFIATLDSGIIRNGQGVAFVNFADYKFIEGKAPATVNPALWHQAKLNGLSGMYKVADGIYEVRSFDVANIIFIATKSGYIVVDPLTNIDAAKAAFGLVKKHVGDKPVIAVITTHSHADHFGGIEGVVSAEDVASGKVKYIVPAGFYEESVSENVLLGNVMRRRAAYQFGTYLPKSAQGQVDFGLARGFIGGASGLLQPNYEVTKTGEKLDIDGVEITFQLTPNTEAPAELTFYIAAKKAYFSAELASHSLHNVLTPRGAKTRDAKAWAHYLDEAIDLFVKDADVVIPAHTWPVYGHARSVSFIEKQRDLYKYIHDQTVHLANKGLNADEIAETIKLPDELAKEWYNRDFYGTVKHNSKAVYQFYLGWWDGNPADYNKLPQTESAKKYVEWLGGAAEVIKKAQASYDKGEYRWVAEVLKHVVFADPDNQQARNLQADAFEQLAYQSESGIWRNLYLAGAKDLREGAPKPAAPLPGAGTKFFSGLTPEAIFDYLSVAIDGPKAAGKEIYARFIFPELKKNILVYLKNGVLHQTQTKPDLAAEVTLTIPKAKFAALLGNPDDAIAIIQSEGVSIEGDPFKLRELFSNVEKVNPIWNIVTP